MRSLTSEELKEIDEIIKHYEEMAEVKENGAIWVYNKPNYEECMKSAKEYRQIARLLKELKETRKLISKIKRAYKLYVYELEDMMNEL